ncbi:hypothetical protein J5069_11140 [Candidatus Symbiopectobacterium sp. NZEC127]|uniref:DUF5625 family protein n=1 Tax=Candidatus Symbiopectobacterium sp. NZEC127 TaxID=2820472 RepID=UPI002226E447|nr:DUF5625 family protein [Candidatus Symbiopectobacterium sp. NZEC127]MCW2486451.1 hypothetical protein [Candidatus Symbiopectobacterium sp. NZEC127]
MIIATVITWLRYRKNKMILLACFWLVACTEPLHLYQPIDVTRAGQTARFDFKIHTKGDYRFALLFDTGSDFNERRRRFNIFGEQDERGVALTVSLVIVKDGHVFFDEKIKSIGTEWTQHIRYEGKEINTAVRNLNILTLPPGNYQATVSPLSDTPEFNGILSFFDVDFFNPKI